VIVFDSTWRLGCWLKELKLRPGKRKAIGRESRPIPRLADLGVDKYTAATAAQLAPAKQSDIEAAREGQIL